MPDFNQMLRSKSMTLLHNYALHPADDIEGYRGDITDTAKTTLKQGSYKPGITGQIQKTLSYLFPSLRPRMVYKKTINFQTVAARKKVAMVNLVKRDPSKPGFEGAEAVDVRGTFTINPTAKWVPAYFLPWATGAIVQLTIPKEGTISSESAALDPDIFFTAAISGCSVFIQGAPENPTVYHAGGDTGRGDDLYRSAAFWREVLTNFADLAKGKFQTEINKTHYVKTPGQKSLSGSLTTAAAREYEKWLKDQYKTTLEVKSVNPWGAVIGYRNEGKWKFYLQENATIAIMKLQKGSPVPTMTRVAQPMVLREVFPGSGAVASFNHPLPVAVTST